MGQVLRSGRVRLGLLIVAATAVAGVLVSAGAALTPPAGCTTSAATTTCTFLYTGVEQTFTVPTGVTTVHVDAIGAGGAAHDAATGGGGGAEVAGNLAVTPGHTLYVEVGGTPTNDATVCYAATPCVGGWNGGGSDVSGSQFVLGSAGGGGGASDVRTASIGTDPSPGGSASLDSRQIVAAGGGGGASTDLCLGGDGGNGGSPGTDGANCGIDATGSAGGAGGTNAGGSAGSPGGKAGSQGSGGNGVSGLGDGGAGGGGLYGGGGGAGGQENTDCSNPPNCVVTDGGAGGGGGGSNLVPASGSSGLTSDAADVVISYTVAPPDSTAPTDAPVVTGTLGSNGWYTSDVSVAWNWTDETGGSGIDTNNCTQSSGSGGAEGAAVVVSSSCHDLAGNPASDSRSFKIDKTKPTVTYTGNARSYTVDQQVSITCAAADANGVNGSGVASTSCANVSGPAAGFGLGLHSFSATATDHAGNTGNGSASFTVTVSPASLCNLTLQYADGSAKYLALTASQKAAFNKTVGALCTADLSPIKPGISPAKKAALIAAYKLGVNVLAAGGWLTKSPQATRLAALTAGL